MDGDADERHGRHADDLAPAFLLQQVTVGVVGRATDTTLSAGPAQHEVFINTRGAIHEKRRHLV
ncbi:MAG: hypothetical protein HHJ19_12420 [Polaromonas sp.]|nr:hypothetical protein [Polaromonas sp.]